MKKRVEVSIKMKRIGMIGLAGGMLLSGSLQVNAATLEDIFDEHYYADTYRDLKEAFGYDREALWNHFVTYGLGEGRNMNGLIDVAKYREEYADLDAFGATENREARDEQVVVAEKEAAKAAEEARKEQENQKPEEPSAPGESEKPEEPSTPQDPSESQARTERKEHSYDNGWDIVEYDASGKMVKRTIYNEDGSVEYWYIYEYDVEGRLTKQTDYNADGNIDRHRVYEYNSMGKKEVLYRDNEQIQSITQYDTQDRTLDMIFYFEDGSFGMRFSYEYKDEVLHIQNVHREDGSISRVNEYDGSGKMVLKATDYDEAGSVSGWEVNEYNESGKKILATFFDAEGNITKKRGYEYNEAGIRIRETVYNADGSIGEVHEYDGTGKAVKVLSYKNGILDKVTEYDEAGRNIQQITIYNSDGKAIMVMKYENGILTRYISITSSEDGGTILTEQEADSMGIPGKTLKKTIYDAEGNLIKEIYYDADGNEIIA